MGCLKGGETYENEEPKRYAKDQHSATSTSRQRTPLFFPGPEIFDLENAISVENFRVLGEKPRQTSSASVKRWS